MDIFDVETNAVNFKAADPIAEIRVIHCIVINGDRYNDQEVWDGGQVGTIHNALSRLMDADVIAGHNIARFDVPALQKMYPWFKPKGRLLDSLVLSELAYGKSLYWKDKGKGYGKLTGRHSLAAWGLRLHDHKGDYVAEFPGEYETNEERAYAAFAEWNQDMEDYCAQDVHANTTLFNLLEKNGISKTQAAFTDSQVAYIIGRQERRGFKLDLDATHSLVADLSHRREVARSVLAEKFPPFYLRSTPKDFTPKRDNKAMGYCAGATLTKVHLTDFDPGKDADTAIVLQRDYGWVPVEHTDDGHIQITETILKGMRYDVAKQLLEHRVLDKRLSQIAEADASWLALELEGRVHGRVNINGTRTGRMSHEKPNMSACPKVGKPYGEECRGLWIPSDGFSLVGADLSGIELRCLGHYLARFDEGAYVKLLLEGDAHSRTLEVIVDLCTRDGAKTFTYAYLYGAGNEKLGRILLDDGYTTTGNLSQRKLQTIGKRARTQFEAGFPGLAALRRHVDAAVARGWMLGLDGRRLYGLSKHNGLNSLLQSAGGVIAKKALCLLEDSLGSWTYGTDYAFVCNSHDEWQAEVRPELAEQFGKMSVAAMVAAGEHYNLRCPLDGEYKVGESWCQTH